MSPELARRLRLEAANVLERLEDMSRINRPQWTNVQEAIGEAVDKVETLIDELDHVIGEKR